jgi:hypothetical protein
MIELEQAIANFNTAADAFVQTLTAIIDVLEEIKESPAPLVPPDRPAVYHQSYRDYLQSLERTQ